MTIRRKSFGDYTLQFDKPVTFDGPLLAAFRQLPPHLHARAIAFVLEVAREDLCHAVANPPDLQPNAWASDTGPLDEVRKGGPVSCTMSCMSRGCNCQGGIPDVALRADRREANPIYGRKSRLEHENEERMRDRMEPPASPRFAITEALCVGDNRIKADRMWRSEASRADFESETGSAPMDWHTDAYQQDFIRWALKKIAAEVTRPRDTTLLQPRPEVFGPAADALSDAILEGGSSLLGTRVDVAVDAAPVAGDEFTVYDAEPPAPRLTNPNAETKVAHFINRPSLKGPQTAQYAAEDRRA